MNWYNFENNQKHDDNFYHREAAMHLGLRLIMMSD